MAGEVARVARRLEEAKDSKILDLAACELNQVPEAIYLMLKNTELDSVDLSRNHLKRIQSKFCLKLPTLIEIKLQENKLSTLPEEVKNLEHFKVLDISKNNFELFPVCLYECEKLTKLTARNNKITELDIDRLEQMSSLQELDLQDNPLSPDVLSKLKTIDSLTVYTGAADPIGKELDKLE